MNEIEATKTTDQITSLLSFLEVPKMFNKLERDFFRRIAYRRLKSGSERKTREERGAGAGILSDWGLLWQAKRACQVS